MGTMFNLQSAKIGSMTNYSTCLKFGVHDEGLYLGVLFLFRPGHPPLMIPWEDLEVVETNAFFLFLKVTLTTRMAPNTKIHISKRLANKLRHASGRELI